MRRVFGVLLPAASVFYPLLWYWGREHGWFDALAAAMMLMWAVRGCLHADRLQRLTAFAAAGFFAAVWLLRQPQSMYWYPVWVNALMLGVFGGSLFAKQTAVERLARLQNPDLPPRAVAYTRRVTQIWCVFFVLNGTAAAVLAASGRYGWWAAYTGVIAYVLMGLLLGGEFAYRKWILKV